MDCKCLDNGKNGTNEHLGAIHILRWIKNPIETFDWIGKIIKSCDNHLNNYLSTGFFEEI